jgi:hypothetical protein
MAVVTLGIDLAKNVCPAWRRRDGEGGTDAPERSARQAAGSRRAHAALRDRHGSLFGCPLLGAPVPGKGGKNDEQPLTRGYR